MRREWLARPTSWGEVEREMNEKITDAQGKVHAALLDNFDTPTAMAELLAIVADANTYLADDDIEIKYCVGIVDLENPEIRSSEVTSTYLHFHIIAK